MISNSQDAKIVFQIGKQLRPFTSRRMGNSKATLVTSPGFAPEERWSAMWSNSTVVT